MSSAIRAIEGGDLAYGLGDGAEVLAQDRTVVARDLLAHLDVRVAGGHSIEAGAYPFLLITASRPCCSLSLSHRIWSSLTEPGPIGRFVLRNWSEVGADDG